MKVLIIEDEAPAFRRLQRILEAYSSEIEIIDVIDTVADSVKWLEAHQHPDLIFMDIQLADGISFEIFEKTEVLTPVIFTTAYDEYTLKAFKVNSIDYLLKPIDEKLLAQSLQKFDSIHLPQKGSEVQLKEILKLIRPEEMQYKSRFLVKTGQELISLKSQDIAYFYLDNGIVYTKTQKGNKYHLDSTLELLEKQLNPREFFRLNRQYLVHLDCIQSSHVYDKGKILVEVKPKAEVPVLVSRDKASEFRRWLDMG